MSLAHWVKGGRGYGLLLLLCLGLYLPGLAALPVTDRDEARFAQASRQMLESGDFLRIRFQDEARNKKPAGIYWLQSLSVALLGDRESTAIWPYRVPSVIGAIAAALLTFGFAARATPREVAFAAAALLAASLGVTIEAHLAKTDAALLATAAAAQFSLGEIYRASRSGKSCGRGLPLLFWGAQGVGILIKGPITPLLSLLTVAALSIADRDWRWLVWLRPLLGLPLAALIAGPWLIAITLATDGAFMSESVGTDFLGKLLHGQESHGAPPGTYLAIILLSFWPGSVALGAAALVGWRQRTEPATRFLLAWIVPFWLVLEAVPTKLPNYILPVYPALALLAARTLLDPAMASHWRHWLARVAIALWAVLALAIPAALLIAPLVLIGRLPVMTILGTALSIALVALFLRSLREGPPRPLPAILAALVLWPTAFAWTLPALDPLWPSRSLMRLVASVGQAHRMIVIAGDSEPSLVFSLGTETKFMDGANAARFLERAPHGMAVIEGREENAFQHVLRGDGVAAHALGQVSGFNYSNGRSLVLTLYERAAP